MLVLFGKRKKRKFKTAPLTPVEEKIFNEGERLIPGLTHDQREVVRHRSSYEFFRAVIERDLSKSKDKNKELTIVDLGSGVGHGCKTLSGIKNVSVTGLDSSPECIAYAAEKYGAQNIRYEVADLVKYMRDMPSFDYVVSRGVLEHVPNGLRLAAKANKNRRLIFDVPYMEGKGNRFHLIRKISEKNFRRFKDPELFYQDLDGIIYDEKNKPEKPNMIICACREPHLPKIADMGFKFPIYPLNKITQK